MDEPLHRALGLTDGEADEVTRVLGRPPNDLELAMFAVMWSEHCSYKSSRIHLKRLPADAPWVLVGPNEGAGAGVIDAGDGIAIAMRIESHNHPSAVEPYQGAATGVGGILRDVFTMGARPIAVMDPLRFGPLSDARNRWIFEGVVRGISGYGNSVGVPTVGGEVVFDECYADNPLVNVFCLGVMPVGRLTRGRASGPGNLAVLVGSSTGRDGIGGASVLASAGFSGGDGEDDQAKRPSVQVGDPFEEKRLIEACLEILDRSLAVGVQDLGAAGITGAVSETASKGSVGMDVWISEVPQRETGMVPTEVMTSESQERMLVIASPEKLTELKEVCARWEVRAAVIGTVTGSGRLRILDRPAGEILADVPAAALDEERPLYDRPCHAPQKPRAAAIQTPQATDPQTRLLGALADPSWLYRQYDHQLFLNTVVTPGSDAAVLKLKAPGLPATTKAIALSTDGNARWCTEDPRRGTAMIVAESCLNVACAGARPVALVNCLNFGNPEHPEVMWQLSESIDGMAEACRALRIPVIGGNVSLYNESRGADIDPTPVVAVLGIIDHLDRRPPGVTLVDGAEILLLGGDQSELDYHAHTDLLTLVAALVTHGEVDGIHDVADGGLAVAVAEMAVHASLGFRIRTDRDLFAETPSRVVVCTTRPDAVARRADTHRVPVTRLGTAGGDRLVVDGVLDIPLTRAVQAWRGAIPDALETAGAVGG